MYERIIVADDGSRMARSVIPRTSALAVACGSEVLVIRVSHGIGVRPQDLDEGEWRRYVSPEGRSDSMVEPLEAEPRLSGVVAELQSRGVRAVGSLVLHGDPGDALIAAADGLDADLLVLSSRGETGLKRAVLGSVAEHLIHDARKTAILLCPATEAVSESVLHRVMVTLDGSELAEIALPHAEHLAQALDAELVLLRVTDGEADLLAASMFVGSPPVASIPAAAAHAMAAQDRAAAEAALKLHETALRSGGFERVTSEVVAGQPASAILEASERLDVDVLVMATHGRGGAGRLLLGSVADAVARNTDHAAVLLVRPSEERL